MRRLILTATLLAAGAGLAAADAAPLAGMWGAGDALLALGQDGGRLQVGCRIARFGPVSPDAAGRFSTDAQVEPVSTMPPQNADDDAETPAPPPAQARLTGALRGNAIDLVLSVDGQAPRTLSLILSQRGNPARCL